MGPRLASSITFLGLLAIFLACATSGARAAGTAGSGTTLLPERCRPVLALALSPDGSVLAAGRRDAVWLFDLKTQDRPGFARLPMEGEPVYSLAWSPDGRWLAAGGVGKVRIWEASALKSEAAPAPARAFAGLSGRVNAILFSSDSSLLIAGDGAGGTEGWIRQWKLGDGMPAAAWAAHGDAVLSLVMLGDGTTLVSGGGDKLVKLWESSTGKAIASLEGHGAQVTGLALSPEKDRLGSAGADREVFDWDLKAREKSDGVPQHPAGVAGLAWIDKERVLTACEDGVVRTGVVGKERRFEKTLPAAPDALHCLALSADRKTVYAGCDDGNIYVWSLDKPEAPKKLTFKDDEAAKPADEAMLGFVNDVLPILSKAGCNAGACHAKAAGQSGFKLSVFAYDPRTDYRMITQAVRGRRVSPASPEESLLLRKPTMIGVADHGGGKRLKKSSDGYRTLVRWIEQGMPYGPANAPTLVAVEAEPKDRRYEKHATQPLKVTARYSDGSTRDVTALAAFSSNEKAVAAVDDDGVITVAGLPGQAVIVARYMGMVAVSNVAVAPDRLLPDSFYASLPVNNYIDRLVYDRLKVLGLPPSPGCTDAEFLRRASLDIIGALPTADESRGFLADPDPQKRAKLIDKLLADPRYGDHWANKWADLLRPNPFRAGVKSVYVLDQWLRESFRENKPYDRFVRDILLAGGSTHRDGPVVVFRDKREPPDIGAFVSQIFLGVRIECARCHHHPNEKWSQDDFYQLAAFFGPLRRKGQGISAPISGEAEYIWFSPGAGEVKHPLTGETMKPKAPDAPLESIDAKRDPRETLAAWMTRPDNPFFAKAAVNRVWAEMMGRGIVYPVDDFRATNPPTNAPLLDALAKDFTDHGYDLKELIRTIARSHIYQLSSVPDPRNAADDRNFSRWLRRRPSAEVLMDAVSGLTGVSEDLPGSPPDGRAVRGWNYRQESEFLDAFARPNPSADPPCERDGEGSVVQALHLMNSTKLTAKIANANGRATVLAKSAKSPREIVEELYFAAFSRPPTEEEGKLATAAFSEEGATRQTATEDVMWALINSAEFVLEH